MEKSKLVTFIGGFYIFGGIIVLLSLVFNGSHINGVFNLSSVPDNIVKLVIGILFIPVGLLYMKRLKIAAYLIIIFSIIFFCISAELTTKFNTQPYIGNMLYSLFVLIVTIVKRKEFCNNLKK